MIYSSLSGARIINSGVQLQTLLPSQLTAHPEVTVFMGGTNDTTIITDGVNYETDYLAHLEYLLVDNAFKVIQVCICTIPTRNNYFAPFTAQVDLINSIVAGLPALFDATNPAFAGRVFVADVFSALGGHAAPANLFSDGLHLNDAGLTIASNAIANAVNTAWN